MITIKQIVKGKSSQKSASFQVRFRDFLELEPALVFDSADSVLVPLLHQNNASSRPSCSSCPPCPMNIRLNLLWRLNLHHQLNIWEIQASCRHISSYDSLNVS